MKTPLKPVYELVADERFKHLVRFSGNEEQSREDKAINFVRSLFHGRAEHRLRMLRPDEYQNIDLSSVTELGDHALKGAVEYMSPYDAILEHLEYVKNNPQEKA
jgi:hypothetical protein